MEEYLIPQGYGEAEFTEKRSRFIGRIWCVESEQEAQDRIREMKKQYPDATHHCWAYILRDGTMRFSDDGEPGGTAGNPMMQVLQKEDIWDVLCVVTRYFGGILLGAGGLVRAYTKGAKIAVDAAGKAMKRVWTVLHLSCPYGLYEKIKKESENSGAIIRKTDFAQNVDMEILVARPEAEAFSAKITDISAGTVTVQTVAEEYRAFPVESR